MLPCLRQVEVAVIMQTVSVLHDTRTSATALAAALNAAALDASLQVIALRLVTGLFKQSTIHT